MLNHKFTLGSKLSREMMVLVAVLSVGALSAQVDSTRSSGTEVTFTTTGKDGSRQSDVAMLPNVALYVPGGQPPTPFLPAAPFSAEWRGFIAVELRDNFNFQAELNGKIKLEINGVLVIEATAKGTNTGPSNAIRLNKGANPFTLHFESPPDGDAFLRLAWSSREFSMEPVSYAVLSHDTTPELQQAERVRFGRDLFIERRCVKCHALPTGAAPIPELSMDAPTFDGIGSRKRFEWLTRWIADPASVRPSARMPRMLHGAKAAENATAISAFVASLKPAGQALLERHGAPASVGPSGTIEESDKSSAAEQIESGKGLFEKLHCEACHDTTTTAPSGSDLMRSSLTLVRDKFRPGALEEFLRKPQAHFAWTRMPDFKLAANESAQLAAYLSSLAQEPKDSAVPTDPAIIERGGQLVQTSGCLNCHTLKMQNRFTTRALADLPADRWQRGCMAETAGDDSRSPQFGFRPDEIKALQAFAGTDRSSLSRQVATEFAQRQTRLLNCRGCHGRFEGFPPLDFLGGKLRPEWTKEFVEGTIAVKPRFWLDARMPAFPSYASGLAHGLAMSHGFPPQTLPELPVDNEAAAVGRRLVAAPPEGFACVQCHGVAKVGATQVFESNGINLALTGTRLLKPYYQRWVRNPLRVDPTTKMPVYFDEEGRSPLTDIYGGDGSRQIDAIWQYIRLGEGMPQPPGTQSPP